MNAHNFQQRLNRLDREIKRFATTIAAVGAARTTRDKHRLSVAVRCLGERVRELKRLHEKARAPQ